VTMNSNLTSGGVLRVSVALVVVLGLLGGGLAFFLHGSRNSAMASTGEEVGEPEEPPISVKTVYPRYDQTFTMTEKRPADVLPYYRDQLDSRVAGEIVWIQTAPGDVVKKGDPLVDIYVPERAARVKEEEAALVRANAQVEQKKAGVNVAVEEFNAAKEKIKALEAKLRSDQAYYEFRKKQADRYAKLLVDRAIDAVLVDEQEDRLVAARETVIATNQAYQSAKAELKAVEAKINQAVSDRDEAIANVKFTEAELEHAKAQLDFARIHAPFDGVIVERNEHANKGAIVQSADQGHPTPLLVIERQDIVTVVMRVPDIYAPYITPQTEAIFETPSLPGVKIRGKVTRYPPSLINPAKDRTMLVEVDLWNHSPAEFNKVKDDPEFKSGLKNGLPGDPNHGLPIVPQIEGKLRAGQQSQLLPGMFGEMTLVLRKFDDVYMLPSKAIVTPGGVTYIYVVKDGKAHLQRVSKQVDDGKLVKVELLDEKGEVLGDLTGKEEVVVSNQGELSEGQPVKPVLEENWKSLMKGSDPNEKR
jgi:multidrug efflux pump subunit AcrA (membrane-fusion protein)